MTNKFNRAGFALALLAGFGGCDSNSTSNTTNNTTVASTGRSAIGECPETASGANSTNCTGQEAYETCVLQACDAQYQACFGPEYKAARYAGACKVVIECVLGCSCGDSRCEASCYLDASEQCSSCIETVSTCEDQSNCVEPQCRATSGSEGSTTSASGGAPTVGAGGAAAVTQPAGGASAMDTGVGSPAAGAPTAAVPEVCPYTVTTFDCALACTNLKAIAGKCQSDPALSAEIQAVLQLANSGTGTACRAGCAASSPTAIAQWECFQGVPVAANCTAIAGCTIYNCP